jgi:hypothetical protein
VVIRLDGLYGNAAPLTDVLDTGLGVVARSKEYTLLDRAEVKARLTGPADGECTHPESGASRALYDCPDIPLAPGGPRVRLIVATHPATSTPHKIGKKRDGVIYELFITQLPLLLFRPKTCWTCICIGGPLKPCWPTRIRSKKPIAGVLGRLGARKPGRL